MKIKELVKKSIKTRSLAIDTFCYLLYRLNITSKYTSSLMSMDAAYYKIRKKYNKFLNKLVLNKFEKKEFNYIWVFWYQGIENAPDLVKKCINSIKKNFTDKKIILITKENFKEYIDMPEYILKKVDKGIISITHFSDIIRLALLVKYGGLWLDATVFCTGNDISAFEEYDMFVYRNGWLDMDNINTANWLIYSKTNNNNILACTLQLLYKYWEENNYAYNYFIFHMFFRMATEKYSEEWKRTPYLNHINNHLLMNEINNIYDKKRFNTIQKITNFHKLSYKEKINFNDKSNFYNHIFIGEET